MRILWSEIPVPVSGRPPFMEFRQLMWTRQKGRYSTEYSQNIQHVSEDKDEILQAIEHIEDFRKQGALFGKGNSTKQFLEIVHDKNIWEHGIQKVFIDRWG